ncbi:MAG: carbon storage regulator [Myxococcales bacterium]|nr:carbon storage regulator [Myxococcales bacterium]
MLIIQRRVGQRIVVGAGVEVVLMEVSRGGARIGVAAPHSLQVLRGEVYDDIVAANAQAATLDADLLVELSPRGR